MVGTVRYVAVIYRDIGFHTETSEVFIVLLAYIVDRSIALRRYKVQKLQSRISWHTKPLEPDVRTARY